MMRLDLKGEFLSDAAAGFLVRMPSIPINQQYIKALKKTVQLCIIYNKALRPKRMQQCTRSHSTTTLLQCTDSLD